MLLPLSAGQVQQWDVSGAVTVDNVPGLADNHELLGRLQRLMARHMPRANNGGAPQRVASTNDWLHDWLHEGP